MRDPYLAIDRLSRSLGRIVLLEERLDEDAETGAARIAEEQDKRDRDETEKDRNEAADPALAEKNPLIRRAVRNLDLERGTPEEIKARTLELARSFYQEATARPVPVNRNDMQDEQRQAQEHYHTQRNDRPRVRGVSGAVGLLVTALDI